jgi:hypothetical protein
LKQIDLASAFHANDAEKRTGMVTINSQGIFED